MQAWITSLSKRIEMGSDMTWLLKEYKKFLESFDFTFFIKKLNL